MDRHLAVLIVLLLSFPSLPAIQHPGPVGDVADGSLPHPVPVQAGGSLPNSVPVQDATTALTAAGQMTEDHGSVLGNLFIENAGQLPNGEVLFYLTGQVSALFTRSGVVFRVLGEGNGPGALAGPREEPSPPEAGSCSIYRMDFAGAHDVRPEGLLPSSCTNNFFFGNDPAEWRTGVRSFGGILYPDLYDNIDLKFISGAGGMKYEFTVRPGGVPADIRLSFEGATPSVEGGMLLLDTPAGQIRDSGFAVYQEPAGGRRTVQASLTVEGDTVGYDIGRYDRSMPLVIDPIVYSTVLGGSRADYAMAIALDGHRYAYIAGETLSADFPTTAFAFQNYSKAGAQNPTFDLFVLKLAPNGSRPLYSTFIGSSGDDYAHALRVDGSGAAYVVGNTFEFDFPVTNSSFDPSFNGLTDAFALKLSPSGAKLVYSTFIGGESEEHGYALALREDGTAVVAGSTSSPDLPTTPGAFQTSIRTGAGFEDAFVFCLAANGSGAEYCTYLGGAGSDYVLAAEAGPDGCAYLTGATDSLDFPVTEGAYDASLNGQDAFVTRLSADGSELAYSTLLGGGGSETGTALALDDSGEAYVAGVTTSYSFPVTGSVVGPTSCGFQDCFVSKLDASGGILLLSSYLGGSNDEWAAGVQIDGSGNVYLAGTTCSQDFPTTPAAENRTLRGLNDVFLAKLGADLRHILYSSYLGGARNDSCAGIALDSAEYAYLAGTTSSPDFPGAANRSMNASDVFITKLETVAVPTAPSLSIQTGHHTATVTWERPELGDAVQGYILYRGTDPGSLNVSWRLGQDDLRFQNGGLENGVDYYYAVLAFNASGDGERSAAVRAMPGLRPSPPRDLRGWPGPGWVRLDWTAPAETYDLPVLRYTIFRWGSGVPSTALAVTNATSYEDRAVDNDFSYSYMVCADNIIGESDQSEQVTLMPSAVPSMPANLTAYLNGRTVTLSWDTPVNPGIYPITDYRVLRSLGDERSRVIGSTEVRIYHDEQLAAGNYSYRVVANTTAGEGYNTDDAAVTIINLPPVARFRVEPLEGNSTDPFVFTSTSFDMDVGIVNYTWNFGDGTRAYKENPVHYYPRRGFYNITLNVRDSDGATAQSSGMVEVFNTPPSIKLPAPQSDIVVSRGSSRMFSIVPSDPDEDLLVATWYLNGTEVGTGNQTRLRFPELGVYVVRAAVSDGEASCGNSWNVTVVPPPPPPPMQLPWRWVLGALLAVAFIGGVYISVRGRAAARKVPAAETAPRRKKTIAREGRAERPKAAPVEGKGTIPAAARKGPPVTYGGRGRSGAKKQTVGELIHKDGRGKRKKSGQRPGK